MASGAWVQGVASDDILAGNVPAVSGDNWSPVSRGEPSIGKLGHDWLNHATQGNYDNWYVGQNGVEESLEDALFEIRPGAPMPAPWPITLQAASSRSDEMPTCVHDNETGTSRLSHCPGLGRIERYGTW